MSGRRYPTNPQAVLLPGGTDPSTVVFCANPIAGQLPIYNGAAWIATTIDIAGLIAAASSGGTGTVTSVGLTLPKEFSVAGSPVTTSGTLAGTWVNEGQNTFLAGPSSGGSGTPGFRVIAPDDILAATSGAPVDAPAERTARFDPATAILYIYTGAAWKSVTLT